MTFAFDFSHDEQFTRLVQRHSDVCLTTLALELARDRSPQLEFQPTLDWIAARGEELRRRVMRTTSERETLEVAAEMLAEQHGIIGASESYDEPDGSFLNRVIELRRGIPISLSVLYLAVSKAAGVELSGVAAPLHFLTRIEALEGPLFLDAWVGRRILTEVEAIDWLEGISACPREIIARSLGPVDTRTIVQRMLTNLKVLYARNEDWLAAWPVQNRLYALSPTSYSERRDLALVALKADRPGLAVKILKSLQQVCPPEERQLLTVHLSDAEQQLHRWN
jgi:regulator of sirC expression with transglutaminase-like and TPR domain